MMALEKRSERLLLACKLAIARLLREPSQYPYFLQHASNGLVRVNMESSYVSCLRHVLFQVVVSKSEVGKSNVILEMLLRMLKG